MRGDGRDRPPDPPQRGRRRPRAGRRRAGAGGLRHGDGVSRRARCSPPRSTATPTYFLKRELIYAILGLGALSLATRVDYSIYRKLAYPLLFVSIVLLAAVLKIGSRAGGAIRWFRLGPLSFQPGELAKLALCVYLAYLLARKAEKVRMFSVGFLPPLLVTGLMMGLLLKQPDLGTAAIFGAVALGLLFVAGTRTSYLILARAGRRARRLDSSSCRRRSACGACSRSSTRGRSAATSATRSPSR